MLLIGGDLVGRWGIEYVAVQSHRGTDSSATVIQQVIGVGIERPVLVANGIECCHVLRALARRQLREARLEPLYRIHAGYVQHGRGTCINTTPLERANSRTMYGMLTIVGPRTSGCSSIKPCQHCTSRSQHAWTGSALLPLFSLARSYIFLHSCMNL